jgi:hypothetical protein
MFAFSSVSVINLPSFFSEATPELSERVFLIKIITYKHRLPWVTPNLRKHINKKNKAERKKDP